jgi:BirA family transcriptional regulator, biotin operon repressor / biotin---[acetyl-CoA-carboxylase] ligase
MPSYPAYDLKRLREGVRPFKLVWCPRMRSTNDRAIAMRKRDQLFAPTLVVTGHQTAGRGRGGNKWFSNGGVLTATFAIAAEDALAPNQTPLLAGLAVRSTAAQISGNDDIQLKWPNDIVLGGRKLAGLLCERLDKIDLIGVGLNLNLDPADAPASLRSRLTSLWRISGQVFDPTDALIALTRCLEQTLARRRQQPFSVLLADYQKHNCLTGRTVAVVGDDTETVSGMCEGVDGHGRLLVRQDETLHRLMAGRVKLLKE